MAPVDAPTMSSTAASRKVPTEGERRRRRSICMHSLLTNPTNPSSILRRAQLAAAFRFAWNLGAVPASGSLPRRAPRRTSVGSRSSCDEIERTSDGPKLIVMASYF